MSESTSLGTTSSWVICRKETGEAVAETFDRETALGIPAELVAIPVLEYLQELNRSIRETDGRNAQGGLK